MAIAAMDLRLFIFPVIVCMTQLSFAEDPWHDVKESVALAAKQTPASERTVIPKKYRTFYFDRKALADTLKSAPAEFSGKPGAQIRIPLPNGSSTRLEVWESPIMAAELVEKHPELKSYIAVGRDLPLSGRLTNTPLGFRAALSSADGDTIYIDPYWRDLDSYQITYYRSQYVNPAKTQKRNKDKLK